GDFVLSGRIDAIYGEPDGPWEVVDYKTGRRPDPGDPLTRLQLDVYALACTTVWSKRTEDLRLVYLYLRTAEQDAWPAGDHTATPEAPSPDSGSPAASIISSRDLPAFPFSRMRRAANTDAWRSDSPWLILISVSASSARRRSFSSSSSRMFRVSHAGLGAGPP